MTRETTHAKLNSVYDSGFGAAARLGLVVLATDETLEADARAVFSLPGVALYHTRIPFPATVTPETLGAMADDLPAVLALLPGEEPLDVVGYGCTSGATVIGPEKVAGLISAAHPGARAANPVSAVIEACRALGVSHPALVTPYPYDVSRAMMDLLAHEGIAVSAFASFEQPHDPKVARISPRSILDAAVETGAHADADAVVVSCTNLNTFSVIEEAEQRLGKPVITSNQALSWRMARLANLGAAKGPGRLFQV